MKGKRNKDIILLEGFTYFQRYTYNDGRLKWKCNKTDCLAYIITPSDHREPGFVCVVHGQHNHEAEYEQVNCRLHRKTIYENCLTNNDTPKKVVNDYLRLVGYDKIQEMGNFEDIFRFIRKIREEKRNPKPYLYPDLNLSAILSKTVTNESFYRYGPSNYGELPVYENILIFFSDIMITKLESSNLWAIDGTFDIVPAPYYQLITIGSLTNTVFLPAIYAILPSKTQNDYNRLFELLKILRPSLNPIAIKVDFEAGLISTLQRNFPRIRISGCYFHLCQAIDRQVKFKGLTSLYETNRTVKKYVKCLSALVFVKKEEIVETFNLLFNADDFPLCLTVIYNYFCNNFISGENSTRFPIEIWNQTEETAFGEPRTNNSIEGYHNSLKRSFYYQIYSFTNLINYLRINESDSRIMIYRIDSPFPPRRSQINVEREEKINSYLYERRNTNFGLHFVFGFINLFWDNYK